MSKKKEVELKNYNVVVDVPNLTEAVVDESGRNVLIRVIQEGLSKNGNYYSANVVESFVPHLLEKKKMYINHLLTQNQGSYIGRDMRDWSAQITEAYYEDGGAYAKIHVFESDDWLLERIKKYPEEVGISIDARAKVREGEMEGQDCRVVEEIIKFNSADFVQNPSAGGQVMRLVAGVPDGFDPLQVFEVIKSMDDYVNSNYKQFYRLFQGFESYLWHIMGEYKWPDDGEEISSEELNAVLSTGFDDFKKAMLELDFTKVAIYEAIQEHGSDKILDIVRENVAEDGELGIIETNYKRGENKMDVNELKEKHPELVKLIKDEVVQESEKDGELKSIKTELETVKTSLQEVEKEKTSLESVVDDYKVKEAEVKKESEIDVMLKESKLEERHITETFKSDLMKFESDEEIKKRITEREELVLSVSGKVEGVGEVKEEVEDTEKKDEGVKESKEISEDEALKILTND